MGITTKERLSTESLRNIHKDNLQNKRHNCDKLKNLKNRHVKKMILYNILLHNDNIFHYLV